MSIVTVEYDIRDDQPEETDVFRIDSSSTKLIENLVRARFPHISVVDVSTIATFSGGNARIAIALAGTLGKNEKLSGLGDEDLFQRLFQQRHEHDADLLFIAQACSLVYSFQGEAIDGDEAELPILAALTGRTVAQVHRAVAELKRRDLVQRRNVWRAVLPHALANRLARMALQNIPSAEIKRHMVEGKSKRLLKSFSHRLGFLHDSKEAAQVVETWLAPSGLLGDLTNQSELHWDMFSNVAPVVPASVIATIERTPAHELTRRGGIARLVRSLGYEPRYFNQCIELLAKLVEADDQSDKSDAASCLKSLFYIALSGTHATIGQRLQVVERLLRSVNPIRQSLGLNALDALLEASHFSSSYSFEFGSHSRDYGYYPKASKDVKQWFSSVLKLIEMLDSEGLSIGGEIHNILAKSFRGLWNAADVHDELDGIFRGIAKQGFWREGWAAARQTLKFDGSGMPSKVQAQLAALEKALRPAKLIERIRGVVIGGSLGYLDLDDFDLDDKDIAEGMRRQEDVAMSLGKELVKSPMGIAELLPELVSGQGRFWSFGRGLAFGSREPRDTWSALVGAWNATRPTTRNTMVLNGFLNGVKDRDPALLDILLDAAMQDKVLGADFPTLQSSVAIDEKGIERLHQSLSLNLTSARNYYVLVGGRATDPIPGKDLHALLAGIAAKQGGADVAMEILYMRLFSDRDLKKSPEPELLKAGQEILQRVEFRRNANTQDHRLASIVSACLVGEDAGPAFKAICDKFKKAVSDDKIYAFQFDDFLQRLFKARPIDGLESFLGGDEPNQKLGISILSETLRHGQLLEFVSGDHIIQWCDRSPADRYLIMADVVPLFQRDDQNVSLKWNPVVLALIERAPDPPAFVKKIISRLRPTSWSGSLATMMENRASLLNQLEVHHNPSIAAFARQEAVRFKQEIESVRRWETERDRSTDETFE